MSAAEKSEGVSINDEKSTSDTVDEFREPEISTENLIDLTGSGLVAERSAVEETNTRGEIEKIESCEMSKSDFNVEKLRGGENYHDWCFAIEYLLTLKGLKKCIKEKTAVAGQPEAAEEADENKLDQAKSILALGVEKNLFVHIRDCASALAIWKKFRSMYEDRGLQRKITLLRTLISFRLEECDDMQGYVDGILNEFDGK